MPSGIWTDAQISIRPAVHSTFWPSKDVMVSVAIILSVQFFSGGAELVNKIGVDDIQLWILDYLIRLVS
ncbi:MAG: hypothetical protein LBU06_10905 [Desulfovibrio sp.]|nr:hypothetical protein [Desulfovibrio sp.]